MYYATRNALVYHSIGVSVLFFEVVGVYSAFPGIIMKIFECGLYPVRILLDEAFRTVMRLLL